MAASTSNFQDFIHSRVLRHPTTWIVAVLGGVWGGMNMLWIREAHRAAGESMQIPWLWLEQSVDFLFGAAFQLVMLGCAIWFIAGLMENVNPWVRQLTMLVIYLGLNWLSQYL
jgi:cytochrome c biogenesis protein CcdA